MKVSIVVEDDEERRPAFPDPRIVSAAKPKIRFVDYQPDFRIFRAEEVHRFVLRPIVHHHDVQGGISLAFDGVEAFRKEFLPIPVQDDHRDTVLHRLSGYHSVPKTASFATPDRMQKRLVNPAMPVIKLAGAPQACRKHQGRPVRIWIQL